MSGINTFCNKVRMTGMGSLCQVTGLSLSVWQCTVVFVSGGNPVLRERGRERGRERDRERERGGNGRLKIVSCSNVCGSVDEKWASSTSLILWSTFVLHLMSAACDRPLAPFSVWSGQGLGKEQGRAQGLSRPAGSRHIASFPPPNSVTQPIILTTSQGPVLFLHRSPWRFI